MSDFKLEIDERFNLFFYFCERITKTSKFFNKQAKNGSIFKNQVSNYIKIKF